MITEKYFFVVYLHTLYKIETPAYDKSICIPFMINWTENNKLNHLLVAQNKDAYLTA